jgi:hypothetical protein
MSTKKKSRIQRLKPERVQEGLAATPNPAPNPTPDPPKRKAKPSALADTLRDWESLLNAAVDHAAELGGTEPYRAALAESLDKVKQAKGVQELHDAHRQASTRTLGEVLFEGKDRAVRLRGSIRAALGPTTERLIQFGIRPSRRRQLAQQETPKPVPQPEIVSKKADGSRE